MKRILAVWLAGALVLFSGGVRAQRTIQQVGKNAVVFGVSFMGIDAYNNLCPSVSLDYSRLLPRNFSWGVMGQYILGFGHKVVYDAGPGMDPYRNSVNQTVAIISGMGYYSLPVIKQYLLLRGGFGVGAGYHHITAGGSTIPDQWLPYFTVQLQWIVRIGGDIELRFAPLIFSPSRYSWSPRGIGPPTSPGIHAYHADFLTLSVGGRF